MFIIPKNNLKRSVQKAFAEPKYASHVMWQRFKSYLSYRFLNGYSTYPETISLFLTYRCNLKCKMCGQWGESGSSRRYEQHQLRSELTLNILKKLIAEISVFRPNITLFGGEPFLFKNWELLVRYIKQHQMRVNVITNGTFLPQIASQVVNSGIDEIIISLDGPQVIHDEIKRTPGCYDKIMSGLDLLHSIKRKSHPIVNMTSVITEDNYESLGDIVAIAQEKKANSITFHHPTFISRDTFNEMNAFFQKCFATALYDWKGFIRERLPEINPEKLATTIEQMTGRSYGVHVSFYPNFTRQEITDYYTKWNFHPSSYPYRCQSPWMVAYVFPDGTVRPFHSTDYILGNIKMNTFKEIWFGKQYRHFRKVLKDTKAFSACTRCTEFYRY